ncbi:hypothetical protein HUG17_10481 [Dermatophagoides farinae]|uniref:C2H2-type domain-containing protein n=1 Tax=Dermatophagoides farinae TaxID=6954 RepID=A0A9D4NQH1_DERFA|nr:hypothetical protein HUG17_10481 [Dermatophagoides farinae]
MNNNNSISSGAVGKSITPPPLIMSSTTPSSASSSSSMLKISTNNKSLMNGNHLNLNLNENSNDSQQQNAQQQNGPIMTTADTIRRKKKSHLSRDELARVCQLGEVTFESYNNSTYMIAIRSKGDRKSLIGYRCDWNTCGYMNARVEPLCRIDSNSDNNGNKKTIGKKSISSSGSQLLDLLNGGSGSSTSGTSAITGTVDSELKQQKTTKNSSINQMDIVTINDDNDNDDDDDDDDENIVDNHQSPSLIPSNTVDLNNHVDRNNNKSNCQQHDDDDNDSSSLIVESNTNNQQQQPINGVDQSSSDPNQFNSSTIQQQHEPPTTTTTTVNLQVDLDLDSFDDVAKIRDNENKYIIALQKDMKIVGYRCDWPECEFLTCRKYVMVNHINGKHTNQRPYSCDMCNFTFVKRYFLKAHMYKVHKRRMSLDDRKDQHDTDIHNDDCSSSYDDSNAAIIINNSSSNNKRDHQNHDSFNDSLGLLVNNNNKNLKSIHNLQ